jgi:long-chain acyl-CoA synthetase
MEVLVRYLERTDRRVYALVRGADDRDAAARIGRTLRCLFGLEHPYTERVVPVRGDVRSRALGLGGDSEALAEHVSEVVHCAATVSFDLSPRLSRATNVAGTERVLRFAELCQERGGLRRFSHISTAYVAGEHAGCFSEDELEVGQRFRNPYEQSKFEAERVVARWRSRLPITVMRPSIVVAERDSGWTASFNVLYWPLRAFARGTYVAVPARSEAPVDVVPVDYVADAIFALSQAPHTEGATFHLTAGRHTSTVGELVELASEFFGRRRPRIVDPAVYRRVVHPVLKLSIADERRRRALVRSEVYFPYFAMNVSYDDRRSRVALRGTGIASSPLRGYFDRLAQFALAANWGLTPISRAGAMRTQSLRLARQAPDGPRVRARPVPA